MTDQPDQAANNDSLVPELQDASDTAPDNASASGQTASLSKSRSNLAPAEETVSGATKDSQHGDDDDEEEEDEAEDDDDDDDDDGDEEDEDDDDEDEDEEPRLKYARLTQNLNGLYRNGDATSACLVGGDKMVRHSSCPRPPYVPVLIV
jgi:archaellum component FlaD/FlaE